MHMATIFDILRQLQISLKARKWDGTPADLFKKEKGGQHEVSRNLVSDQFDKSEKNPDQISKNSCSRVP